MHLVQDFLQESLLRFPDKTALVAAGERFTYANIDGATNQLANGLINHGCQRGDRVVIFLPNSVETVVGIFGTLKANAVFVVVNPTTKLDKLSYIVNNCQAFAIMVEKRNLNMARQLLKAAPSLRLVIACGKASLASSEDGSVESQYLPVPHIDYELMPNEWGSQPPPRRNIDLDLACIIYTSGSTGDPKGVMSDHSNVVFATESIISYLHNTPEDVVINALPLAFDYGLYQLLMVFRFGGRLVLERSFTYPAHILSQIEKERVTGLPGVPTVFALLLQMDLSPYDLSSLRYITNTAAALPPSHILQLRQKFPWTTLYSMYGLTETKRTLYLPPEQLEKRPDSVGIPIPGTEAWIEDENGNRLPPGVVGELVVRGRHVMRGYWNDPAASAERFRPGSIPGERLCYSGDLFQMDEEGFFYFKGRKDDIIKSRGEKVSPKEVENILYSIPGVQEAAVIGVPDPILGQSIKALLVKTGAPISEAEVIAYCRARLEDFMVPRSVEFVPSLPKTSSGKIKKTELG